MHHVLIPYAAASAEACQTLLGQLALPHLRELLALLTLASRDEGDDYTLTPPHERAHAHTLGGAMAGLKDGCLPWAAWDSATMSRACAWFTPCHWQVGMEQVSVQPPDDLELSPAESQALLDALTPFAREDGIELRMLTPQRWLAMGEVFADLPTASLDRVAHRQVEGWLLPHHHAGARTLLRLQNEAQMLFYTHRVTDERATRGLAAINGFWVSGSGLLTGTHPAESTPPKSTTVIPDALRQAALRGHWQAWQQAWQALDGGLIKQCLDLAQRQQAVRLTLCGERCSETWSLPASRPPLWKRGLRKLGWDRSALDTATVLGRL
jgi:hypothetical protein